MTDHPLLAQEKAKGIKRTQHKEHKDFSGKKKIAIVVGVNSYRWDGGLGRLSFAESDADSIGRLLEIQQYEVRRLSGRAATKDRILEEIRSISGLPQDTPEMLLFYFSGHGFSDSVGATDKSDEKASYLGHLWNRLARSSRHSL